MMLGESCSMGASMQIPFHWGAKFVHHCKSEQNSLLSLIWWCNSETEDNKSIILLGKHLPNRTTKAAWWSTPIRDSRSRFRQTFLSPHLHTKCWRLDSLSAGRRAVRLTESNSMPRKTRDVVGPSALLGAMGTPREFHKDSASLQSWASRIGGFHKEKVVQIVQKHFRPWWTIIHWRASATAWA